MEDISSYFFLGNPERFQINFSIEPEKFSEDGKECLVRIEPDDPRWEKKVINKRLYFHDTIDDYYLPAEVLAENFDRSGTSLPITLRLEPNLQHGTSTFEGVNKLVDKQLFDAYLSAHAIFLRKLRCIVCLHKYGEENFIKNIKTISRKYMAAKAITYLKNEGLLTDKDNLKILSDYNQERNELHDIDSGTTTDNIKGNVMMGNRANKILDVLFQSLIDK